jgi:uncharacterized repeat protein (TIGR01451 family)
MKMNRKIIRLKRFAKSICHCERSVAILVALVLVLSLGIAALPIIGTVEAWCETNPTFITKTNTGDPATNIGIEWSTTQAHSGSHSVHVFTTAATTDYAMVGVVTDFVLTASTNISYWGYTVASSNVKAPDEIWLEFENGEVICSTCSSGTEGAWIQWILSGSSNWYIPSSSPTPIVIGDYYNKTVTKIFLGAGSPTSTGVTVDVYLDNFIVDGTTLLDDDTGEIDVLCGTFCGYTGDTGIQVAINAALPGDIINVAAGTYYVPATPDLAHPGFYNHIWINKPLSLIGEDPVTTIIDGEKQSAGTGNGDPGPRGTLVISPLYWGTAGDVTVKNFTFINAVAFDNWNEPHALVILGNQGTQTIENCKFIGRDDGSTEFLLTVWGLRNDRLIVKDNEFSMACAAICEEKPSSNACKAEITGNYIHDVEFGIFLHSPATYGGTVAQKQLIKDNTLEDCTGTAITIGSAGGYDLTDVEIHSNNITGSGEYGINNLVTSTIDATKNWWGDASGPTHISNLGGTGDAVSDNVNFVPFLFPDVTITKTKTGPATANQGDDITYTITYKNVGTYKATGVVITEIYPSEVKFVSADPEPTNEGKDIWNIGDLAPGEEKTITVTVHIK